MAHTATLPVQIKEYSYKVFNQSGAYIGEWTNEVTSELQFSQRINTPGSTTKVRLARSARTLKERRDSLFTQSGPSEVMTTQDGHELIALYTTNASIGEGTDIDLNHQVDISVAYGGFESILTQSGEELTTQTSEVLLFPVGAPQGIPVFRGYIMDYELTYSSGSGDGVEITLASHGTELSEGIIKSGLATTVTYSTTDHGAIIKSILDQNTGKVDYAGTSVATTGSTITQTFKLNTFLEGIETVYNQSPAGYYWYCNPADNTVYYQLVSTTAKHTFVLGTHIKELKLRKTIENLKNELYFIGGGSPPLYKRYTSVSSITRNGIERKTDRRYTLAASTQNYATKLFARYKEPIYTTSVTIPSNVYEIEDIQLGDVVTFSNFGTFVDNLLLQIVNKNYTPTGVTLELGETLDRQRDIVANLEKSLKDEQSEDIPTTPS